MVVFVCVVRRKTFSNTYFQKYHQCKIPHSSHFSQMWQVHVHHQQHPHSLPFSLIYYSHECATKIVYVYGCESVVLVNWDEKCKICEFFLSFTNAKFERESMKKYDDKVMHMYIRCYWNTQHTKKKTNMYIHQHACRQSSQTFFTLIENWFATKIQWRR